MKSEICKDKDNFFFCFFFSKYIYWMYIKKSFKIKADLSTPRSYNLFFVQIITQLRCQYSITFHTSVFQYVLQYERLHDNKLFVNARVWADNSVTTKMTEPKSKTLKYNC
jgi:hypothetical protein